MVRLVCVGGILFLASACCSALSLGQAQGRALIGRQLDLSVPLMLADGESASGLCLEPKVSFGDDQLPATAVQAEVLAGATGNQVLVRIQTTKPVNEPFLTLDLTVGCVQRSTRSYVLLADLQLHESPSARPVNAPSVIDAFNASKTAALPVDTSSQATIYAKTLGTVVLPPSTNARRSRQIKSNQIEPKPVGPDQVSVVRASKKLVKQASGARLTLDPLELIASVGNASPNLRLSLDAPSEVGFGADIEQRRDVARLLWRSLSMTSEEATTQTMRAEMAANDLQQLQSQLAATQQLVTDARAQIEEERNDWFLNAMVVVLGAGLVLSLGALVRVMARLPQKNLSGDTATKSVKPSRSADKTKQPWWKKRANADNALIDGAAHSGPKEPVDDEQGRFESGNRTIDIELDTPNLDDSAFATLITHDSAIQRKGSDSLVNNFMQGSQLDVGSRYVATEALFDLQQQVEFFISLGQADQAIDVLLNHLSGSLDSSPLAYLDLLKLYHELGQREDYEKLRQDFNGKFSGTVPDFDHYLHSRRGLERYESAISRIQSLWSSSAVLDVIERSIFRRDGLNESTDIFDLEAYRELLLLYGIAREVLSTDELGKPISRLSADRKRQPGKREFSDFGPTTIQPLAGSTLETRLHSEQQFSQVVAGGVGNADHQPISHSYIQTNDMGTVGVDLDLNLDLTSASVDLVTGNNSITGHELDFHLDDLSEPSHHNLQSIESLPLDVALASAGSASGQQGSAPQSSSLEK